MKMVLLAIFMVTSIQISFYWFLDIFASFCLMKILLSLQKYLLPLSLILIKNLWNIFIQLLFSIFLILELIYYCSMIWNIIWILHENIPHCFFNFHVWIINIFRYKLNIFKVVFCSLTNVFLLIYLLNWLSSRSII